MFEGYFSTGKDPSTFSGYLTGRIEWDADYETILGVKYIVLSGMVQIRKEQVFLDSWCIVPINKCENSPAKNCLSGTVGL